MAENWIQAMIRCTGPSPCSCPITGPHDPKNPECYRNREAYSKAQRERIEEALRHDAEQAKPKLTAGVTVDRPLGCALAMRVMQSDMYRQLDDAERADCDELVRQNLEWFKRDSAAAVTVGTIGHVAPPGFGPATDALGVARTNDETGGQQK